MIEPIIPANVVADLTVEFNNLAKTMHILSDAMRPKHEAESWPVYLSEYGDFMCGRQDCSCDCESSIIFTPYGEGEEWPKFTVIDLVGWIEAHIEQDKARREEAEDGVPE